MRSVLGSSGLAVTLVVAWGSIAGAQTPLKINAAVAAFPSHYTTEHNNYSTGSICGSWVNNGGYDGEESRGTAYGPAAVNRGSLVSVLFPPNGAQVSAFRYFVADNHATQNSHAYLVRKAFAAGQLPTAGYLVMAQANSSGANANIRKFEDTTIQGAIIDTAKYTYFVEVVNCDASIRPVNVQLEFLP